MANLKPFRGNTQGPVEDFLRQVYTWSLSVAADLATLTTDIAADVAAALAAAAAAQATADTHASRHIRGGADQIDGDKIDVDFSPDNYTPQTVGGLTTSTEELTSHLEGVDDVFGDHETRIDALESASVASKTTTYSGASDTLGGTASTTYYHVPLGFSWQAAPSTVADGHQMIWGRAGTIQNLRFVNCHPTASANTFSFTLDVDGSTTALTITGLTSNTSTMQSDTTHTVTVAVGNKIQFRQVNGAGSVPTAVNPTWCFDFVEA